MTYGLLRANANWMATSIQAGKTEADIEEFMKGRGFIVHGLFFERQEDNVGFDFLERDLEDFVREHSIDPAHPCQEEIQLPTNYSQKLEKLLNEPYALGSKVVIVVPLPHKGYEKEEFKRIIHGSYKRYAVFVKEQDNQRLRIN